MRLRVGESAEGVCWCNKPGRMINWCFDDELWIHPGFLAAARRIDGTGNEGSNEGRFRRTWNGRKQWEHLCSRYSLSIIETIFHFPL